MKTKFLLWLMSTKAYKFLLKYVIPKIQIIHASGPSWFVRERFKERLKPGDMLVSKRKYYLTNLLIGGKYSHGAVALDRDQIAEMCASDFEVVDVKKFCEGTTSIAILRFKNYDDEYGQKVAEKALSFAQAKYDTEFKLGVEALYCSELNYLSDFEHRMQADLTDLIGAGRPYISPMGVYTAKGLEIVYEWHDSL
jgi:hypothetical protein